MSDSLKIKGSIKVTWKNGLRDQSIVGGSIMKIAVGADKGGLKIKNAIVDMLKGGRASN